MEILGQIRTGKEGRNKRVAIQDLDAAILRLSRPMNRFKRMIKRRLNLNTETCSNVHDVITDLIALKAGQNTINTSEEIPVEVANRNYSNIIPLTGEQILLATAKNVPTDAAKPEDNLYSPLISIVLPTYNSSEVYLKGAIESVLSQSYGKLQLCIIDDGSPDKSCRVHIQNFADKDHRIKVKYLSKNVGIGAASQVGAEMADGEFIGFVDHDDILAPSALSHFVNKLREDPGIDMLYSDHAMINEEGRLTSAALKPGFAPEFLLSTNYIVHFKLVRKSIFNTVGGFEGTFYASQDYGLTLKLLDAGARIVHVPGLLYFWRLHPGSVASGSSAKPGVLHACIKTVDSYLQKNNIPAKTICPDEFKNMDVGIYKLEFQQPLPSVSIVIPVKQESPELIALLVDIENDQGISLTNVHVVGLGVNLKIKQRGLNTLRSDSQEEFDRLMLSIHSDVIVFISPESKLIDSDWLREIVGYFNVSNEIGAVGGKIVDPNDKVIGGGVLFLSGLPTIGAGLYASDTCYWSYGKLVTNVEAVSSDFMAVRKKHYKVAGGFKVYGNELPIGVCIGICLRKAGLRVVYNPWAKIASTKIIRHRKLRALDELELTRYPDRYYNKYFDAKYPYRIKHTQPLRINFALPPSPKISGGPLAILEYANRLAARGHTVTITTYPDSHWEGENPFPWFKFSGKILFKQDRNSDSTFQRGQLLANFSSMPHKTPFEFMFIEGSIWSGLIEAMPDCDINIATYWSTAFPVYFSHKGKPVYFMQHYEEIFYTMQHDYMMHKQMARTSYALPIYKIANSSWLQKLIKEKYEQLIPFSNNGIELSDFTPMPKLSSSDHVIRVVTYSRPEDWKGFSDAVGAMQKVFDKFGDKVQWHVFGYKHETISESNKYATYHYHPRLSFIQLAELYATSDISLCPSWYESFPLPPLESMASGTAVVTTKYGTEDYAFDDYNALVVESRDIDKMADAIVRLIQDKNLRNRLAVEGRRTAELFNWDRAVEERERLIYQIHYGEIDYDVLHSARSGLYDANGVCFESANFKNLPDRGLFTQDGMVFLLYQGSKHHITEGYLTRKIENIGTSWITLTPLDAMRIPWGAALTNESDIPAFPLPEKGLFVDDGKVYLLYQGAKHHVTEEYITKMIDDAGVKWITLSPQEMARVPREAALMSESDIPWDYS
ncbi:MAG: glycosyltransferase, partial [Gammaproteobacteria bacterium]